MYPLLALTIDNSTLLFVAGAASLIVAMFVPAEKGGKIIMVVGIVMLVGGFLMRPNQVLPPSPYPNPYPAPYPNPQPNPYNPTPQPPPFAAGGAAASAA